MMTSKVATESIIARIAAGELGQKIAAKLEAELATERTRMKGEIDALNRERGEVKATLGTETRAALAALEQAQAVLKESERTYLTALQKERSAEAAYRIRINRLENELFDSAPASIDNFIVWLDEEFSRLCGEKINERSRQTGMFSTITDSVQREYWSNAEPLKEAMSALRRAKTTAQLLKREVLSAEDLDAKLKELPESIPDPTELRLSHTW